MRMIASLCQLMTQGSFDAAFARAQRGDPAFFQSLPARVEALAASHGQARLLALHQLDPVRDLDADFALLVEREGRVVAYVTELGMDFATRKPCRMLISVDPSRPPMMARGGNYGPVALAGADFPSLAWSLAQHVLAMS